MGLVNKTGALLFVFLFYVTLILTADKNKRKCSLKKYFHVEPTVIPELLALKTFNYHKLFSAISTRVKQICFIASRRARFLFKPGKQSSTANFLSRNCGSYNESCLIRRLVFTRIVAGCYGRGRRLRASEMRNYKKRDLFRLRRACNWGARKITAARTCRRQPWDALQIGALNLTSSGRPAALLLKLTLTRMAGRERPDYRLVSLEMARFREKINNFSVLVIAANIATLVFQWLK